MKFQSGDKIVGKDHHGYYWGEVYSSSKYTVRMKVHKGDPRNRFNNMLTGRESKLYKFFHKKELKKL